MKQRDAIFDRLALKEKLFINQQMRNLVTLNSELQKLEDMRQKLNDMVEDSVPKIQEQTAFALRSSAELNYQIRDQLKPPATEATILAKELQFMRQKIALSDRRREEKSASKAEQIRRTNRDEREASLEDDDASRRKFRPR